MTRGGTETDWALVALTPGATAEGAGCVTGLRHLMARLRPRRGGFMAMDGPLDEPGAAEHLRRVAYASGGAGCWSGTARAVELHAALDGAFHQRDGWEVSGPADPGHALAKVLARASGLPPGQRVALCCGEDDAAHLAHAALLFLAAAGDRGHRLSLVAGNGPARPFPGPAEAAHLAVMCENKSVDPELLASYALLRVLAEGSPVVPGLPGLGSGALPVMATAYAEVRATLGHHAVAADETPGPREWRLRAEFLHRLLRALAPVVAGALTGAVRARAARRGALATGSAFWRRQYYHELFYGHHAGDFVHGVCGAYRRGLLDALDRHYMAWRRRDVARARYPHDFGPLPDDLQCAYAPGEADEDEEAEAEASAAATRPTPRQLLAYVLPRGAHPGMAGGYPRIPAAAAYMFPTAWGREAFFVAAGLPDGHAAWAARGRGLPRLPPGDPAAL